MTDKELMQQALDALNLETPVGAYFELKNALRDRLEQPEQEPVAWANKEDLGNIKNFDANIYGNGGFDDAVPLYTTPPQRKPLTFEEIEELDDKTRKVTIDKGTPIGYFAVALARAIEAAHGIKGEA